MRTLQTIQIDHGTAVLLRQIDMTGTQREVDRIYDLLPEPLQKEILTPHITICHGQDNPELIKQLITLSRNLINRQCNSCVTKQW